jgi:shikimate 5-dehydrogenase
MTPWLWFVGVTTGQSLIHRAFPLWMAAYGYDVRLAGRDLPLGASPAEYRALVHELAGDAAVAGAVVTAHKVALLRAARPEFKALDDLARECGEVNAIRSGPSGLMGFARDPVSVGWEAERIWPSGDHAVCLGAGGTAIALGRHLLGRPAPPARMVFADRAPQAAANLCAVLEPRAAARGVDLVIETGPGPWDGLIAASPPCALVVNATGLGKDLRGEPVSPAARYPAGAVVWELNYRGDLAMLRQAREQARERDLRVHDGWGLFCCGWGAALGPILGLPDEASTGLRFAALAAHLRPRKTV